MVLDEPSVMYIIEILILYYQMIGRGSRIIRTKTS